MKTVDDDRELTMTSEPYEHNITEHYGRTQTISQNLSLNVFPLSKRVKR